MICMHTRTPTDDCLHGANAQSIDPSGSASGCRPSVPSPTSTPAGALASCCRPGTGQEPRDGLLVRCEPIGDARHQPVLIDLVNVCRHKLSGAAPRGGLISSHLRISDRMVSQSPVCSLTVRRPVGVIVAPVIATLHPGSAVLVSKADVGQCRARATGGQHGASSSTANARA